MNNVLTIKSTTAEEANARTQVVLLLTAHFSKFREGDPRPLTPKEWWRFANWMKQQQIAPELLLSNDMLTRSQDLFDQTITEERIRFLLDRGAALALAMEKWQRAGLFVLTHWDAEYPERLRKKLRADSPPVLFGCGNRQLLNQGGIAVVGSRNATDEELTFTRTLGQQIACQGSTIISGGARGVDESAMLAALDTESGTALGVLPDSLLGAATSSKWRHNLINGRVVLISSFHPEARFDVGNAMTRNKYIYCLADAAIVITASEKKGGTWAGAVENIKNNWVPLWVRPLSNNEENKKSGNIALLKHPGVHPLSNDIMVSGLTNTEIPNAYNNHLFNTVQESVEGSVNNSYLNNLPLSDSFYDYFLNRLKDSTAKEALTSDQLLEIFDIKELQLREWLNKALKEGVAEKLTRPIRFTYKERPQIETSLFMDLEEQTKTK